MIDFEKEKTESGTLVIRVSGRLDTATQEYFFDCVKQEIEAGNQKIVLNCEGVGYISSIGLSSLVRARAAAVKEGGTIYLSSIESRVLDVMHVVKFEKLFNIYSTEEEALVAIDAQA